MNPWRAQCGGYHEASGERENVRNSNHRLGELKDRWKEAVETLDGTFLVDVAQWTNTAPFTPELRTARGKLVPWPTVGVNDENLKLQNLWEGIETISALMRMK